MRGGTSSSALHFLWPLFFPSLSPAAIAHAYNSSSLPSTPRPSYTPVSVLASTAPFPLTAPQCQSTPSLTTPRITPPVPSLSRHPNSSRLSSIYTTRHNPIPPPSPRHSSTAIYPDPQTLARPVPPLLLHPDFSHIRARNHSDRPRPTLPNRCSRITIWVCRLLVSRRQIPYALLLKYRHLINPRRFTSLRYPFFPLKNSQEATVNRRTVLTIFLIHYTTLVTTR